MDSCSSQLYFTSLAPEEQQKIDAEIDRGLALGEPIVWTVEDIVFLHVLLLEDLARLARFETPIAEKLELLRWVWTDPDKEERPFSFRNCIRVVAAYADAFPAFGKLSADSVREVLYAEQMPWLREELSKWPPDIQALIQGSPTHVARKLDENPQWLNEEVKRRRRQPDLLEQLEGLEQ